MNTVSVWLVQSLAKLSVPYSLADVKAQGHRVELVRLLEEEGDDASGQIRLADAVVGIGIDIDKDIAKEQAIQASGSRNTEMVDMFFTEGQLAVAIVLDKNSVTPPPTQPAAVSQAGYFGEFATPVLTIGGRKYFVTPTYKGSGDLVSYDVYDEAAQIGTLDFKQHPNPDVLQERIVQELIPELEDEWLRERAVKFSKPSSLQAANNELVALTVIRSCLEGSREEGV